VTAHGQQAVDRAWSVHERAALEEEKVEHRPTVNKLSTEHDRSTIGTTF
jgi:hypothetical protein